MSKKAIVEVPELRLVGDPILRHPTKEVSSENGKATATKLRVTLEKYRDITGFGRGLAAPQIGLDSSVFITRIDGQSHTYINPKIIEKSNEQNYYREVCMSSPMLSADVARATWILLEWTDAEGQSHRQKFESFEARLIQHEVAHLAGLVNLDEATPGRIAFATFDPLKEELRDFPQYRSIHNRKAT